MEPRGKSNDLQGSGRVCLRTKLTSDLVGDFANSISIDINEQAPALSEIKVDEVSLVKIEVIKHYVYEATIFSTRVKVAEYRGYEVVASIFDALAGPRGYLLMPDDIRILYKKSEANDTAVKRLICDFIAGMTDRYAIEFYGRLHSNEAQSIFKPI